MTIGEALSDPRFRSGELWARSVLWRKCGRAWRMLTPIAMLPFGAGETPMERWEMSRYTSEWELVEPTVVQIAFKQWCRSAQ